MNKIISLFTILLLCQSCTLLKRNKPIPEIKLKHIIYVNENATGNNTGKNWKDAFKNLNDAIYFSNEHDEIWVAKGIYFPTDTLNRKISFKMKRNLKIYGGFSGNERNLSERNFIKNKTILSGNIGNKNVAEDNSYHVIMGANQALLDGFTIQEGYAYDKKENFSENYFSGGGLFNNEASTIIKNCVFKNNFAEKGGAVFNKSKLKETIIFINTNFEKNSSLKKGGAVFNYFANQVLFLNNLFINNTCSDSGGAIFNDLYSSQVIENSIFTKNKAQLGGAIVCEEKSRTILNNTNIIKNTGNLTGGAIFQEKGKDNILNINNSIIKDNISNMDKKDIFNWDESKILIKNYNLSSKLSFFKNKAGYQKNMNQFYNNLNVNIFNSIFIEKNKINKNGELNIIKENSKIKKNKELKRIYVVSDNKNGNWNGESWKTAFRSLQKAIDYAYLSNIKQIWVAKGVYYPSKKNRTISFNLRDNIEIYGGFIGSEKKLSNRNIKKNRTILSGNIGNKKDKKDNSYHIIVANNINGIIDGFIVQSGYANGENLNKKGSGLISYSNSDKKFLIKNTIFRKNFSESGGAVYSFGNSKLYFDTTSFTNNSANYGGAVYLRNINQSNFKNCNFIENKAFFNGGAVYSDIKNNITFNNIDFRENESKSYGGAVYLTNYTKKASGFSKIIIKDSIISDNESKKGGAAITISNNIILNINNTYFFNNYSKTGKNIEKKYNSSIVLKDCIFENNYSK